MKVTPEKISQTILQCERLRVDYPYAARFGGFDYSRDDPSGDFIIRDHLEEWKQDKTVIVARIPKVDALETWYEDFVTDFKAKAIIKLFEDQGFVND